MNALFRITLRLLGNNHAEVTAANGGISYVFQWACENELTFLNNMAATEGVNLTKQWLKANISECDCNCERCVPSSVRL